jgi:diguanylate cyclase (GGDEF)-like protein
VRGLVGISLLLLIATLSLPARAAGAMSRPLEVRLLGAAAPDPDTDRIVSGALDAYFEPLRGAGLQARRGVYWLKIPPLADAFAAAVVPVLVVRAARQTQVALFAAGAALRLETTLPAFRGARDRIFALPADLKPGQSAYARIETTGLETRGVSLSASTLSDTLDRGAEHARMIALAVGALTAMALAALLIWFMMADKLFILYSTFFFLQALYIAFLSGQGFDWPGLSYARPLGSFAWNVPIGLSGAVACLFVREIADLKNFAPQSYAVLGWCSLAFVVVTVANIAKLFGFVVLVNAVGNLLFCLVSVFALVAAFLSWRRGNRAAGWFLIAWGLLEGFTIATTVGFLGWVGGESEALLYYGLPLSMAAAAVLIALGVADRLRQQREALTAAELRAQTDPLTGVLNRRSLVERLDAACLRARGRGLPIALLFIDLDHFKLINDSFGHQAGDACLRAVIGAVGPELRQSDVIGRFGGEEFVVILSGADAAAALPIAQRIRERVANIQIEGFGRPIVLTCSIGVAASDTLRVWGEELLSRADAAVYAAKRSGRNRVHLAVAEAPDATAAAAAVG